jgi:hypothetical protein
VKLMTAHRILIGTAIAFFAFYSFYEFRTGGGAVTWRSIVAALAALGLALYFATLFRAPAPTDGRER